MAQATGRSSTMTPPPSSHTERQRSPWAAGLVLFAGIMMVANGILSIFEGAVGVTKNGVYAATGNYTYKFDVTSWGWIHIAVGAAVAIVGLGVIAGLNWARYLGIFVVALSMFANFMFLPYYPLWALVVIAIDVFVLWALCVYRRGDQGGGARTSAR
ncbi:hypothetical protein POF50_031595 [Streptomyces sp. SL13]|jgi:hypothetical protein|uniref:DUF7144 domain-containing protein n=1 Tax=Streptantibioticus silvisoli TaxID=2705255 RepID=A0AA90H491_9ACTN|nr:hypothetical protein [Streptantibioticus silvisoli]MDI5961985.1 hypothetical protein [Streptantibioticus silvisoli]MDI5973833.1 hypothetical protein [Streptantibioticus silvisoli]